MQNTVLSPSDFVALVNQTLEYAYPEVLLEGEVSGFKLSQGKFVFFDLKDTEASVSCFMMAYQLNMPITDGMQVRLSATVKLRSNGRFSLSVRQISPVGEGALARSFELLKNKLEAEGLFSPERKRPLPPIPRSIGLISSKTAAGAKDFLTILAKRWPYTRVEFAQVAVQGATAPDQLVRAIEYFNQQSEVVDVLVLVRGGGSLDDLMSFNAEPVVRAIAGSRIPTLVGVGHEDDLTLADLAADLRAATPTQAAVLVAPDRLSLLDSVNQAQASLKRRIQLTLAGAAQLYLARLQEGMSRQLEFAKNRFDGLQRALKAYDPNEILRRGYGLIRLNGAIVTRAEAFRLGVTMAAEFSDGVVEGKVSNVKLKKTR